VDATVVERLRSAGALLIGKANMFEIGISPSGDNPIHGFARNPYDLNHDAGGSSGGCGGAVAAGLAPLAIGADGGGSIRVPASHCGIVGLKPTFGRVSEFGAAPLCWSLAHIGPMAATALDLALGYAVCAGRDARDPMTHGQPPVDLNGFQQRDLRGLRLGWYPAWFEDADPEIVRLSRDMLARLEDAGASLHEITLKGLEAARVAHGVSILSEMATAMDACYVDHRSDFAHATRLNLVIGRAVSATTYLLAQRIRTETLGEWSRVLGEVDAVLTPTSACAPPFLDREIERYGQSDLSQLTELMRFVSCANFTGLPAISFPAGYTAKGLPVGVQAIGRRWEDSLLLRLALVAEQHVERRRPAQHHDLLKPS
jgi:Asp-tRNA(Asn)/Glu-tRNA(Gln) amidotransferase A subunit family amidase